MPSYRLIADHGDPAAAFDAPDDDEAERLGRRLSDRVPAARTTGFHVERLDAGRWRTVLTWMPARARRTSAPVGAEPPAP